MKSYWLAAMLVALAPTLIGIDVIPQTQAAGNSFPANSSTTSQASKPSSDNITALFSLTGTVIAAALASFVGIFTAISNRNQNIELAKVNAKLTSQRSEEDALREYRF